jgi:SAM-dependent methyltransferase
MLAVLRAKDGAAAITAVLGDMKATRLGGDFSLVYLVFNTIMNVTTQDEQVAVFQNAAAHLRRGGRFVVEVIVPQVHRVAAGAPGLVSDLGDEHVGIDTFEDVDSQITWSHHWTRIDGRWLRHSAPYRYVWPAELELMARLTGFRTSQRWSDWTRRAFAPDSPSLIAVFEKG